VINIQESGQIITNMEKENKQIIKENLYTKEVGNKIKGMGKVNKSMMAKLFTRVIGKMIRDKDKVNQQNRMAFMMGLGSLIKGMVKELINIC
jgi:hypothetical protein